LKIGPLELLYRMVPEGFCSQAVYAYIRDHTLKVNLLTQYLINCWWEFNKICNCCRCC